MKKIIHLSDLHFGTEHAGILPILAADILAQQPDMLVVSGDLTQRARISQYKAARDFLFSFAAYPIVCVPGNHDIALYNIIERFMYPYDKYNRYIKKEFLSFYNQNDIAMVGINSVTPYKAMSGYVTQKQLQAVTEFFRENTAKYKLVVMHHNLIRAERHKIINASEDIIKLFAACQVNLVLCGHIHAAHIEHLERNHFSHHMYVITAGTAISNRTIEPNSYNVINLEDKQFDVVVREFNGKEFVAKNTVILPI